MKKSFIISVPYLKYIDIFNKAAKIILLLY